MGLADQVAVDHGGVVRALAGDAAGGVGVGFTAVLAHGVVVDHGVHVSGADQIAQARRAENIDRIRVPPVRLGADCHLISGAFQHTADDGVAEGGVVHIGVADDVDEIRLLPAQGVHFRPADGKKAAHHRLPVEPKPPSPRTVSDSSDASTNFAVR